MSVHTLPRRVSTVNLLFVAVMLLSYPVAALLPQAWGMENAVIENVQVLMLLYGCAAALVVRRHHADLPLAALGLAVAPVWFVLAARELSWGAVLLQADAVEAGQPLQEPWYKPAVAPAIIALLIWSGLTMWHHRLHGLLFLMVKNGVYTVFPLFLAVASVYFSACAEGHFACGFTPAPSHAFVWEEGMELIAYAALLFEQQLVFQAFKPPAMQDAYPVGWEHGRIG